MRTCRKLTLWGSGLALLALLIVAGCGDDKTTNPTNHSPIVTSVMVTPSSVVAGGTATVTVVATDPDGDAMTYAYAPNGGSIPGVGSSVTWTAPSQAGAYSVAVTVSDGRGGTGSGSGSLTVTPAQTGITGSARATPGVQVDLRNSLVRLFANYDDFVNDRTFMSTAAQGTEYNVTFTFTGLPAGTYYLDLWKDMDNDTFYTADDLYGIYGTFQWPNPTAAPVVVNTGQMTNVGEIMLYEL